MRAIIAALAALGGGVILAACAVSVATGDGSEVGWFVLGPMPPWPWYASRAAGSREDGKPAPCADGHLAVAGWPECVSARLARVGRSMYLVGSALGLASTTYDLSVTSTLLGAPRLPTGTWASSAGLTASRPWSTGRRP